MRALCPVGNLVSAVKRYHKYLFFVTNVSQLITRGQRVQQKPGRSMFFWCQIWVKLEGAQKIFRLRRSCGAPQEVGGVSDSHSCDFALQLWDFLSPQFRLYGPAGCRSVPPQFRLYGRRGCVFGARPRVAGFRRCFSSRDPRVPGLPGCCSSRDPRVATPRAKNARKYRGKEGPRDWSYREFGTATSRSMHHKSASR